MDPLLLLIFLTLAVLLVIGRKQIYSDIQRLKSQVRTRRSSSPSPSAIEKQAPSPSNSRRGSVLEKVLGSSTETGTPSASRRNSFIAALPNFARRFSSSEPGPAFNRRGSLVDFIFPSRRSSVASNSSQSSGEKLEKAKPLYGGDGEPLPDPTPLMIKPEDVEKYDDRPWRPFRWPYHQTMSIFKLDINHWLDMDKWYYRYIKEKERIYHEYGDENIAWLPEGYDACLELMEMVVDHMEKRYPLLFKREGDILHNLLSKEDLDLSKPLKEHPLIYVSKLAKEDFYVVMKRDDGRHYLVGAAVPFPGGSFGINTKIGKHLDFIHQDVPYYNEKLKVSMERWFARMKSTDPVERASWYITWDHQLLCNNVYKMKPDDKITEKDNIDYKEFNVRVERQTLRRLPKSQAIIFTNHPIFYSIDEMKDEPMIPSLLKKIVYEAPEGIIKYKNFQTFRDYLNPYLDGLIQRQYDLGIISKEDPVKTIPTYPFAHWTKDYHYATSGWKNPALKEGETESGADK